MTENKTRNILVIGNGFDIAHGYKTKYIDFLNYLEKHPEIVDYGNNVDENVLNNNIWISYFQDIKEILLSSNKEKWIDFEQEISNIVFIFDNIDLKILINGLKSKTMKLNKNG